MDVPFPALWKGSGPLSFVVYVGITWTAHGEEEMEKDGVINVTELLSLALFIFYSPTQLPPHLKNLYPVRSSEQINIFQNFIFVLTLRDIKRYVQFTFYVKTITVKFFVLTYYIDEIS